MKHLALGLLTAILLGGSSGCCCFWHKLHQSKMALLCGDGPPCGTTSCCEPGCCDTACGVSGCDTGCGNPDPLDFGCGIFSCGGHGCGTHYLQPHGAHYGAYCGTHCQQLGCGQKYWGDWISVPPRRDPCNHCGGWIGDTCHCGHGIAGPVHGGSYIVGQTIHEGPVVAEAHPPGAVNSRTADRPTSIKTGPTTIRHRPVR